MRDLSPSVLAVSEPLQLSVIEIWPAGESEQPSNAVAMMLYVDVVWIVDGGGVNDSWFFVTPDVP